MGWTGKGSSLAISNVMQRLRAAGLRLEGMQFRVLGHAPDSSGFEFTCEKADQLLTMVANNRKFGPNTVSLPGKDPWRDDRIESIGYSEIGVFKYLHLDFATEKEGLCRVYEA